MNAEQNHWGGRVHDDFVGRAHTPDWKFIHKERRQKNVTLRLLWQEYRQAHPEG